MKRLFGVLLVLAFLLFIINIPIFKVFSFEQTRTEEKHAYFIERLSDENEFQFIYTHSIHLSTVVENFSITKDDQIRMISMEYEDVAIGMPGNASEGETLTFEDGKYTLSYKNRIIPSFTLHLSNIDSKQSFAYNGYIYDLKNHLKRGTSYFFEVKKISLYERWKGEILTYDEIKSVN